MGLPPSAKRRGFGSNESTWDTPPLIYMKITRFAFPGKCGALGASGLTSAPPRGSSDSNCAIIPGNNIDPHTIERTICRRLQLLLAWFISIVPLQGAEEPRSQGVDGF